MLVHLFVCSAIKLRSIQNGCSSGAESDLQKKGSKTGFGDGVIQMALT